jgi:hypothetical protein
MPRAALMIGSRIYSHRLTTCEEDFDDALLYLWFQEELVAEIQVGRNHVAGYRTEVVFYGEEGEIQVDRFHQKPREVIVTAYGRRGRTEVRRTLRCGVQSRSGSVHCVLPGQQAVSSNSYGRIAGAAGDPGRYAVCREAGTDNICVTTGRTTTHPKVYKGDD